MHDVAIGIVLDRGKLTIVVRFNRRLYKPSVQKVSSPAAAAAAVLGLKFKYHHDNPAVYIAGGSSASALLAELDAAGSIGDVVIGPTSPPATVADGGQVLRDRLSELLYRIEQDTTLHVPAELYDQLTAFQREPGETIGFTDVVTVARSIGDYPGLAVAAALATIGLEPLQPKGQAPERPFNPYEALEERIRDRELRQARHGDGRYRIIRRKVPGGEVVEHIDTNWEVDW